MATATQSEIGEMIRRRREALGWSRPDLAEASDVDVRLIRSYESEGREPKAGTWIALDDALRRAEGKMIPNRSWLPEHALKMDTIEAGAGPGRTGVEEIIVDRRMLSGTTISGDHVMVRVVGDSMEPDLSHGQYVAAEYVDGIQGDGIYVYWSDAEEAHLIAEMERMGTETLELRKSSGSRTLTWAGDGVWRTDNGGTEQIEIIARVIAGLMSPAHQRGLRAAQARSHAIYAKEYER